MHARPAGRGRSVPRKSSFVSRRCSPVNAPSPDRSGVITPHRRGWRYDQRGTATGPVGQCNRRPHGTAARPHQAQLTPGARCTVLPERVTSTADLMRFSQDFPDLNDDEVLRGA
jgi:hypothetical protein